MGKIIGFLKTGGEIPAGVIVLWSGLLASIPSGWQLCDGTNGTPDMRGRFVRGAPAAIEAGTTGGADTVTLSAAESGLPSHTHAYTGIGSVSNGIAGANTAFIQGSTNGRTTAAVAAAAAAAAHENKPVFRELQYIMKL